MSDKTLVIVDMQECFMRDCMDNVIDNIKALIRHARDKLWPVVIVEYLAEGEEELGVSEIIEEITEALRGYDNVTWVGKQDDDGGWEVNDCIQELRWPIDLVVCGVYANQCVAATVAGYLDAMPDAQVDVVDDAVWPHYASSAEPDIYGQQIERQWTTKEIMETIEDGCFGDRHFAECTADG
jgi:nicotinamidase-related amidase